VFLVVDGVEDSAQTVHLHGHSFYVTRWRGATGAWRDVSRPLLRDTVTVPRGGAITIQFHADNPGEHNEY
jgi:FtsP/CotA-like multicopper oxidase with cupredoxin domain